MPIVRYEGNQRAGKTITAVIDAVILSNRHNAPLYANIWLNKGLAPLYRRFETWSDLKEVYNSIILFDEIHTSIDSRNFKSREQMVFTHLFSQMGKRGNHFLYTVQRLNTLEKRLREQTDFVYNVMKQYGDDKIYYAYRDTQRGEPGFVVREGCYDPKPFYALYNTWEVVKSHLGKVEYD